MSNQCRHAALIGKKERRKKILSISHLRARDAVDVTPRESKSFEALLRGGEKLFSPLRHWVERKRRRTEIKRREEGAREREREGVKAESRARRAESEREGDETKGAEEGIGELCLQYDRGLTRAKVARVTPSSY